MQLQTYIFMGPPGSGKGTQAVRFAEKRNLRLIGSGKTFRKLSEEQSVFGEKLRHDLNAGFLLPYWVATYLFHTSLFSVGDDGVVFDGFARKPEEAEVVADTFDWLGRPYRVIYLHVPEEVVRARIAKRRQLENRADDREVEERLHEYLAHTTKAIDYLRGKGVVIDIDGAQDPDVVEAEIAAKVP